MLEFTDEMIMADIKTFQGRIQVARKKLAALPAITESWKDRKKLKNKRRALQSEIKHVSKLISIAEQGLVGN